MRAACDRGIWRVVRGSKSTGAATSSLRTGAGDRIESTRGFRAGRSAEGAGSEAEGSTDCGLKSASAARRALVILLAIITAKVGLLLPVVEQGSPRLFDYSRDRSGVRQLRYRVCSVPFHADSRGFRGIA